MASPYLERMQQLDSQRTQKNTEQLSRLAGLPIQKPGDVTSPSGVPTGSNPRPENDDSYKESTFYQNFDFHRQQDPHFDNMVGELTQLATGLRQQVQDGFMPPQIAQQRVHQYVVDTMAHYARVKPQIEKQKNTQMAGIMLQQLAAGVKAQQGQEDGSQPQPDAQQAQPTDGGNNGPVMA